MVFHHDVATFCIFFSLYLFPHRDGSQVCQACSYWSLDQHSSKERGWEANLGMERAACAAVELAEPTSTVPVRDSNHRAGATTSALCCWSLWDLRYLLCMTLPMCTKIHSWFWARSLMAVCFIKGQADHFCPALTLCRFIKHSLRSLSLDRKFMPKVSLMPNTTW